MITGLPSGTNISEILARLRIEATQIQCLSDQGTLVYRIADEKGCKVVRVYPVNQTERAAVEAEVYWLRALERDTDLLTPHPIAFGDHFFIHEFADLRILVIVLTWVEGEPLHQFATVSRFNQVGALLGRLHEHSMRVMKPETITSQRNLLPNKPDSWPTAQISSELACDLDQAGKLIGEQMSQLKRQRESFGFAHGDFHPWNLLCCDTQIAAIDFGDCGWGPYVYDIASALVYIKYPLIKDFNHSREYEQFSEALVAGYRSVRKLPENFEWQLEMCLAARLLLFVEWVLFDFECIEDWPCTLNSLQFAGSYLQDYVGAAC